MSSEGGVTRRTLLAGATGIAAFSSAQAASDPLSWTLTEAAQALVGKTITADTAMAAANAAVAQAKPLSRNKYKITLTKAAVKRAILNAANGHSGSSTIGGLA